MTDSDKKLTLLYVGASGMLAEKVLPALSKKYSIIGLSHTHKALSEYCTHFYTGNLLTEHERIFKTIFSKHNIDAIIWTPVRYFPMPLIKSSREILHTEFDLAVALPLECLKLARAHGFHGNKTFTLVSSGLATGIKENWGSYSIAKAGENVLGAYLCTELSNSDIAVKVIAFGSLPQIQPERLTEAFCACIENADPHTNFCKISEDYVSV